MDKAYITRLLQRYFTNQATHAEREALFAELEKNKNNEDWADIHTQLLSEAEEIKGYDPERYQSIINTIMNKPGVSPRGVSGSGPRVMRIWKWIAAAAIILLIVGGWWMIEGKRQGVRGGREVATTHDVPAPTNTRAVITLADGSKVYLDSAGNGILAQQNNVKVVRNEKGEIVYAANSEQRTAISPVYNTLFNPRGSKVISLTLSDGTKVWLNAESSLRYPISFASGVYPDGGRTSATVREVEITGEAYFEVKHNAKQPFKVHLPNGSIVEDIGTAFNINAYPDEEATKTTLIEGSVRVRTANGEQRTANLKPGEQLVQSPDHLITTSPDIDEVMAWKNGLFQFNNADIETVMRQVARWYDVDVVYEGKINKRFRGEIPRSVNASQLFEILESTGWVHFKIEGKKVIVSP